jgi:hypothetical protein
MTVMPNIITLIPKTFTPFTDNYLAANLQNRNLRICFNLILPSVTPSGVRMCNPISYPLSILTSNALFFCTPHHPPNKETMKGGVGNKKVTSNVARKNQRQDGEATGISKVASPASGRNQSQDGYFKLYGTRAQHAFSLNCTPIQGKSVLAGVCW